MASWVSAVLEGLCKVSGASVDSSAVSIKVLCFRCLSREELTCFAQARKIRLLAAITREHSLLVAQQMRANSSSSALQSNRKGALRVLRRLLLGYQHSKDAFHALLPWLTDFARSLLPPATNSTADKPQTDKQKSDKQQSDKQQTSTATSDASKSADTISARSADGDVEMRDAPAANALTASSNAASAPTTTAQSAAITAQQSDASPSLQPAGQPRPRFDQQLTRGFTSHRC